MVTHWVLNVGGGGLGKATKLFDVVFYSVVSTRIADQTPQANNN